MLAARLCRVPITTLVVNQASKPTLMKPALQTYSVSRCQTYSTRASRFVRRQEMKDTQKTGMLKGKLMQPAGEGAFSTGRMFVVAASGLGLGALCFYGLGLSAEPGTIEYARTWPAFVRERVRYTYMYFAGGVGVTAATAVAVSKNARLMNLMTKNSLLAIGATFAMVIGTNVITHSIPYKKGIGAKQLAWLTHAGVLGAVVAPLTALGGPILLRAAWMTAGIVGGLSTLAICAPSEKFLNMGGPLACGFGLVFASSIAGMFLPPTTALGAGLYSISIYGGLVLFGMFLLYDTQKIVKRATSAPQYSVQPFDPVNASLGIYADTLNIFIRLAIILSGGGGRRK